MRRRVGEKPPGGAQFVEEHFVEGAREFVTIQPHAQCWQVAQPVLREVTKGAIVRIRPPSDATGADVDRIEREAWKQGAAAVKVERRKSADVVDGEVEPSEARPQARARQVVLEIVEESNADVREPLRHFVEEVMGRCSM